MSKIRLHGTSSGYTDIAPTAAAGNNTLTAPTSTGTLAVITGTGDPRLTLSGSGHPAINLTNTSGSDHTGINFGDSDDINAGMIQYTNNGDYMVVHTAGAEVLRIDSSGRLLLGTTTEGAADADDFTIASSSTTAGITIRTSTSGTGRLWFSDGTSGAAEYQGYVQYDHNTSKLIIGSGGGDKVIVDANGNTNISGITTATAFVPTKIQTSHKNIIINGAMQVAQRGTSNTNDVQGYRTVDRFTVSWSGLDSVIEQHQGTLSSSDGDPYNLGFRNTWKLVNGDQTGGAGASDYIQAEYRIEAQDLATSGWHYKSASSYITVSFWLKTSVSQNFTINFTTFDGTAQRIPMKTGTISANTWTKITKTVPGNSNIDINNDTGKGMSIMFYPYLGNSYVGGSTLNVWSAAATPNFGGSNESSWYTTNDATFEVTGFQLEVGEVATPFEFRSYTEELLRCARYYQEQQGGSDVFMYAAKAQGTASADVGVGLVVPLRASPTVTCSAHRLFHSDGVGYTASTTAPTVVQWDNNHSIHSATIGINAGGHSGITNNECCTWSPSSASLLFDAEL